MGNNDITGDRLVSKVPSETYKENYDKIFGKKSPCSCHGCDCEESEQDKTTLLSTRGEKEVD